MADLAQQIRERLDGWAPPGAWAAQFADAAMPTPDELAAFAEDLSEAIATGKLEGPVCILPPSPKFYPGFEQMRGAILAAVDDHGPDPGSDGDCRRCVDWDEDEEGYLKAYRVGKCPTLVRIAKALGIEVFGG